MRHAPLSLAMAISIVAAGCSFGPTGPAASPPAEFLAAVDQEGMVFAVSPPLTDAVLPADALARIRRMQDPPSFVYRRPFLEPIFGVLSCGDRNRCDPDRHRSGVWVIQFPGPGPEDPLAWVAADGTAGGLWLWGGR